MLEQLKLDPCRNMQSVATIEMESDIPYTHGDSQVADP